ncbi:MAG TPA: hypothetical protein VN800_01450 [Candidatus Acidoferrales bacterium]|nr:hypothetical protein [Candidatus Acidoferrales bacterium]
MTDLENRLAELEQRLAAMEARGEHAPKGLLGAWHDIFPSEVRTHMRAARKEQLLAARAFLDHWIERVDRYPADELPRRESISLD